MPTLAKLLLSSLVLGWLTVASAVEPGPNEVVETTVRSMAQQIDARRSELTADKKALYALIDKELLPRFDTPYAGRLVLGKAWRTATPAQRDRFIEAFYNFLLRSYATAVLKFDQKQIRILPSRKPPVDGRTTVETEMRLPDAGLIPVNYAMRLTPSGWKAYDVRIEGISYVQNYRNQFNAEVAARGIDALILRLEKEAAEMDAGRMTPQKPGASTPQPAKAAAP